jgi:peptidoglycan/LPS O-acetylase OafA/YrhL
MPAERNATLEWLRGAAAVIVFTYHLTAVLGFGSLPFRGYIAVDFFFMLSGYVIAHTYTARFDAGMSATTFFSRRLRRLYPLIVLGLLLGAASRLLAILVVHSHYDGMGRAIDILPVLGWGLLLLPFAGLAPGDGLIFPLDGPLWSLMFELWANLAYALGLRRLGTAALALLVAIAAVGMVAVSLAHGTLDGGTTWASLGVGLIRVVFGFSTGMLVQRLVDTPLRALLPRLPAPVLTLLLLLAFLPGPSAWGGVIDALAATILCPLVLILGIADPLGGRGRRIGLFAGALSYPLYTLHVPIFSHLLRLAALPLASRLAVLALSIAAGLGLAWLAERFYDAPLRGWAASRGAGTGARSRVPT